MHEQKVATALQGPCWILYPGGSDVVYI